MKLHMIVEKYEFYEFLVYRFIDFAIESLPWLFRDLNHGYDGYVSYVSAASFELKINDDVFP
jgi:hypothetical protein